MIRIAIADDHPIVREGLRRIVADDSGIVVVGEASTGEELKALLRQAPVDVILLDISMPESSLVEMLQFIQEHHRTCRVLVLSVHPEDQWAVRALRSGASGYLTKDHSPDRLLAAIRRVYRGGKYVSDSLAERLATEAGLGLTQAPHERLSDREFEVLCALGSGITVKDAAAKLGLSPKTVSTYRARILEKMNFSTGADLVRYAAQHGLIQ